MLIISAHKYSDSKIRFEFAGPAAHILAARSAMEAGSSTQWVEGLPPSLIVQVSPALLNAIASMNMIESIDGTPFVPVFVPTFGHGQKSNNHL